MTSKDKITAIIDGLVDEMFNKTKVTKPTTQTPTSSPQPIRISLTNKNIGDILTGKTLIFLDRGQEIQVVKKVE